MNDEHAPQVRPLLVLLPSPLLGPAVWTSVASRLSEQGWPVAVPPPRAASPETPDDVLAWLLAAVPEDRDVVLVPHSNAGLYVPAIVQERRVVAMVFVDAGLPPAAGSVPLAPPAFRAILDELADADGLLPPWTQWWEEADIAPLFPDPASRRRVEAEQPRLPLRYFHHALVVEPGWDAAPAAYLAFGETYAEERAEAAARGWPSRTLAGGHLHALVDPAAVAAAVVELLADCGIPSGPAAAPRRSGTTEHPR